MQRETGPEGTVYLQTKRVVLFENGMTPSIIADFLLDYDGTN